ncbi:MAG: iron-containing alcohol dehydrogenase [Agathobacter sp.]|nr:iron-containing alcohol dehydrogenase [Agathobacter sp.]
MNPLRKIYCRAVHIAFRLVKPLLPYREPKILNAIEEIPSALKQENVQSVLLVTDSFLRKSGMTASLEKILEDANIHCAVYDKTQPNPTVHNVAEAKCMYMEEKCECLIALGGGSAMDCAKAVGACIVRPGKTLSQLKGVLRVMKKIPTLIAIPTTAGTGSEVTLAAVITDPETKHKYPINDFVLIPNYAVLDPKLTYTLPPSLTSTTGMDALTHAVEAYIGHSTNKKTRANALEATRLIFENIETAYTNGTDYEARKNMLRAAYLAGEAFSISYVGYVHAVAHPLGGQYNIPHGLANSVLLPIVLDSYGKAAHKKLHQLAIAAGIDTAEETDESAANKFIDAIRGLNERMNIPSTLEGIKVEDIPVMADHADKEGNPLYPVPVLMNAKELEQFYYMIMKKDIL